MMSAAARERRLADTTLTRDYKFHDVLDGEGGVAHLSYGGDYLMRYGAWYSLCGRVVPSWRMPALGDTDHDKVCASCHRKATRRSR
jgi:hypothetical protein